MQVGITMPTINIFVGLVNTAYGLALWHDRLRMGKKDAAMGGRTQYVRSKTCRTQGKKQNFIQQIKFKHDILQPASKTVCISRTTSKKENYTNLHPNPNL